MGTGTYHDLVGVPLSGRRYPVLRVADGGEWRLDLRGRYQHLLGARVGVRGRRSEFDMLDVDSIDLA